MRLVPRPGRITAGEIMFDGRDVRAMDDKQAARLPRPRRGDDLPGPVQLAEPGVPGRRPDHRDAVRATSGSRKSEARTRAVQLLDEVGIPDPERRALSYPHELSGGMRQRVMIALATASEPRLLLADEPTTALDVTTQAQILALLTSLREKRGLAVLLVSHDFGVIAQVCDRVAVMYGGYVVETGTLEQLYTDAQHPYTRALLESVPRLESAGHPARRPGIAGVPPELTDVLPGCVFKPRCRYAQPSCESISMALETVLRPPRNGVPGSPVRTRLRAPPSLPRPRRERAR